jgi:pimeloyl-ACP methyl ester carboxylesterase
MREGKKMRSAIKMIVGSGLSLALLSGCMIIDLKRDLEKGSQLVSLSGTLSLTETNWNPKAVFLYTKDGETTEVVAYQLQYLPGPFKFVQPEGEYFLAAFEDVNGDLAYQQTEPAGFFGNPSPIRFEIGSPVRDMVITIDAKHSLPIMGVSLSSLGRDSSLSWNNVTIGGVVPLDDDRFGAESGRMGLWQPYQFVEQIGGGIYLLEAFDPGKTPVLFVHGANGYPQNFTYLIEHLDRDKFQPWVYMYPSGLRLDDLSTFLVRGMVELHAKYEYSKLCVVAHSMGGLVSRSFVNQVAKQESEFQVVKAFVTISTPWAGHAASQGGVDHSPAVIPSWLDMIPGSPFQTKTLEEQLPEYLDYYLLFSYRGGHSRTAGGASDGAVALASQLDYRAQKQAIKVYGFDEDHVSILDSAEVSTELNRILSRAVD